MDFLENFTSGRYHREIKILKILACNSKRFKAYGIFKKWKFDGDSWGVIKYYIFFDNFYLK